MDGGGAIANETEKNTQKDLLLWKKNSRIQFTKQNNYLFWTHNVWVPISVQVIVPSDHKYILIWYLYLQQKKNSKTSWSCFICLQYINHLFSILEISHYLPSPWMLGRNLTYPCEKHRSPAIYYRCTEQKNKLGISYIFYKYIKPKKPLPLGN